MSNEEKFHFENKVMEKNKAVLEYLRFLTTLSTGSLVLLVSLLESVPQQTNLAILIGITFLSFVICIISCVIIYTITVANFDVASKSDRENHIWGLSMFVSWVSFLIAIISLAIFGIANF